MLKPRIYNGEDAAKFLPDLISGNNISVVSPVIDTIRSFGDQLGLLLVAENRTIKSYNNKFTTVSFTKSQSDFFLGSFVFVGTNPMYFGFLFQDMVFGKYSKENICTIDAQYKGLVSYQFISIIKENIEEFYEKSQL